MIVQIPIVSDDPRIKEASISFDDAGAVECAALNGRLGFRFNDAVRSIDFPTSVDVDLSALAKATAEAAGQVPALRLVRVQPWVEQVSAKEPT